MSTTPFDKAEQLLESNRLCSNGCCDRCDYIRCTIKGMIDHHREHKRKVFIALYGGLGSVQGDGVGSSEIPGDSRD